MLMHERDPHALQLFILLLSSFNLTHIFDNHVLIIVSLYSGRK